MTLSVDKLLDRAIQERVATALETQPAQVGADGYTVTYVFPTKDFGAGWTEDIQSPLTHRGKVIAVFLTDVTEAFVGTTSIGPVHVGIQAGDADAYGISEQPTTTGVAGAESLEPKQGVVGLIPAGEDILVTGVQNVGGAITGIATVTVVIKYFI